MKPEMIGYLALGLGLLAISMKNIYVLRSIHALSAITYVAYGFLISSNPILIGGVLFVLINMFHLFLLFRKTHS